MGEDNSEGIKYVLTDGGQSALFLGLGRDLPSTPDELQTAVEEALQQGLIKIVEENGRHYIRAGSNGKTYAECTLMPEVRPIGGLRELRHAADSRLAAHKGYSPVEIAAAREAEEIRLAETERDLREMGF